MMRELQRGAEWVEVVHRKQDSGTQVRLGRLGSLRQLTAQTATACRTDTHPQLAAFVSLQKRNEGKCGNESKETGQKKKQLMRRKWSTERAEPIPFAETRPSVVLHEHVKRNMGNEFIPLGICCKNVKRHETCRVPAKQVTLGDSPIHLTHHMVNHAWSSWGHN